MELFTHSSGIDFSLLMNIAEARAQNYNSKIHSSRMRIRMEF